MKESYQRQMSMSRVGGTVAGGGSVPPGPPPVIYRTFKLGSVLAGNKGAEDKREAISRTNSEPLHQRKLEPRFVKEYWRLRWETGRDGRGSPEDDQ